MPHPTIRPVDCALYFLPVEFRMPLKFGAQVIRTITCARVCLTVEDNHGRRAQGWGETPLSAGWAWPATLDFTARSRAMESFCVTLAQAWASFNQSGHPITLGNEFNTRVLPALAQSFHTGLNNADGSPARLTTLAALVCNASFDIALHDAYGNALGLPSFQTYNSQFMDRDLAHFLQSTDPCLSFAGKFPQDFLRPRQNTLTAWHLVGGLDPLTRTDAPSDAPRDGHPVTLEEWIKQDGLKALKIKLRGNDPDWDYSRLVAVANIAQSHNVDHLSADFNCTAPDAQCVTDTLDRLREHAPDAYRRLLYVEQPFPYELHEHPINVSAVAARKPIFLDESAHDWQHIRLGLSLGWNGVALKTCKTLTGALLSLCWARAHDMQLMVQDLTNPMLAAIPHALLAAHAGTIMGVESNAPQYYPDASAPESAIHTGLYRRRNGVIDISSATGAGLGYRIQEISRTLPAKAL
jgi:L-alanine-DL-glutamate epimerase-like enolase superfamily enzyme